MVWCSSTQSTLTEKERKTGKVRACNGGVNKLCLSVNLLRHAHHHAKCTHVIINNSSPLLSPPPPPPPPSALAVFSQVLAGFRYGRDDLDVLGLNFRRDLIDVRHTLSLLHNSGFYPLSLPSLLLTLLSLSLLSIISHLPPLH